MQNNIQQANYFILKEVQKEFDVRKLGKVEYIREYGKLYIKPMPANSSSVEDMTKYAIYFRMFIKHLVNSNKLNVEVFDHSIFWVRFTQRKESLQKAA